MKIASSKMALILMFLVSSCFPNEDDDTVIVQNLEADEILSMNIDSPPLHKDFLEIGEALLKHSNADFRSIVYTEVEKQFDGDYNVLIKTLLSDGLLNESDNLYEVNRIISSMEENIEFPQVYIPFYEDLKKKEVLGKKNPIIVFNLRDESITEFPGYALDRDGNLSLLNFLISEDFASKNEIWVVGTNERIGQGDFVSLDLKQLGNENLKTSGISNYGIGPLHVESIYIHSVSEVESWISGKLELKVSAVLPSIGPFMEYNYPQIKRGDINRKWKTVNTHIVDWNSSLGDNMIIHWAELDGGTSGSVSVTFPGMGGMPPVTHNIPLGSDDDDMGYRLVQRSDQPLTVYNTGLIQWKMVMIW